MEDENSAKVINTNQSDVLLYVRAIIYRLALGGVHVDIMYHLGLIVLALVYPLPTTTTTPIITSSSNLQRVGRVGQKSNFTIYRSLSSIILLGVSHVYSSGVSL